MLLIFQFFRNLDEQDGFLQFSDDDAREAGKNMVIVECFSCKRS